MCTLVTVCFGDGGIINGWKNRAKGSFWKLFADDDVLIHLQQNGIRTVGGTETSCPDLLLNPGEATRGSIAVAGRHA